MSPMRVENLKDLENVKKKQGVIVASVGAKKKDAILEACEEIMLGNFDEQFIIDAIQGGAGTSTNT